MVAAFLFYWCAEQVDVKSAFLIDQGQVHEIIVCYVSRLIPRKMCLSPQAQNNSRISFVAVIFANCFDFIALKLLQTVK